MDGKEARYYLNKELDKMRYWQPLPTMTFDVEDHVLLDYIFRKIADTPSLAKQAGSLRKKLAMAIADYGYSIAEKEHGPSKTITSRPTIIMDVPVGKKESVNQNQIVHDILKAIREKHVCVVAYESFSSGAIRTYQIHPLTIFEHNGGLYVFVFQPYYEKVIILALERIQTIQISDEHFDIPEGYDAEKRLSDPFGIVLSEEPFIARIQFDEDQARYIQERDWPEGTEIEELEDGSIILKIETAGGYELKKWLLGFGQSAELLEPGWLRDELMGDIARIAGRYSHQ
jgi:predicted DNA-binding transcriptional regulator YafY